MLSGLVCTNPCSSVSMIARQRTPPEVIRFDCLTEMDNQADMTKSRIVIGP